MIQHMFSIAVIENIDYFVKHFAYRSKWSRTTNTNSHKNEDIKHPNESARSFAAGTRGRIRQQQE